MYILKYICGFLEVVSACSKGENSRVRSIWFFFQLKVYAFLLIQSVTTKKSSTVVFEKITFKTPVLNAV